MGAFKLGKMTFGSLFKKPETVLYPIETKPQPEGLKGHIEIFVDECILCGMCERSCTTNCITVDKDAKTWSIDRLQCVQCGYCITVCPKKCLVMNPNYAAATTLHEADIFAISEQEKKPAKKAAAPAAEKAAAPAGASAAKEGQAVAETQSGAAPEDKSQKDSQLEELLSLMDPEKAEKVRAAL